MLSIRPFILRASTLLVLAGSLDACAHQDEDHPNLRRQESPAAQPKVVTPPPVPPAAKAPRVETPSPLSGTTPTEAAKPTPRANSKIKIESLQLAEPLSAPVRRMIAAAEENLKKGKLALARAQADRAFRLDLSDPRTAYIMARVAAAEKDYSDAEQWAERALDGVSEPQGRRTIWNFIAMCRQNAGDKKGLAEALRQVNML